MGLVGTVTNGFFSSLPLRMTRSRPPCSHTNTRPSGANAMLTGESSESATTVSVKPARMASGKRSPASGSGAACAAAASATLASRGRRITRRKLADGRSCKVPADMSQTDLRLPDLRFVPTEDIYPHELHDLQRTQPLVERLRASGTLRNPPIVTQI